MRRLHARFTKCLYSAKKRSSIIPANSGVGNLRGFCFAYKKRNRKKKKIMNVYFK